MSAPIDHKKPTVAFVLLFVLVSAILGNGLRARADGTSLALAVPTTIEAATLAPAARAGHPSSDAAALAGALTRTATPAADGSPRDETRAAVHGHRHAARATRARARGPLGHEGTSVGGALRAHGVPRVAVPPGTGALASVSTGLHRPTPRAAGVPVRVSARASGVTVRVGLRGLRAGVRVSLRALAGPR